MVFLEEGDLTVVRALTGGLEKKPLFCVEVFWCSLGKADAMFLIVRLNEVLDDSTCFPDDDVVVVGVSDGGEAAIGIDSEVLGLFDIAERNIDDIVGEFELIEEDGGFWGVGTAFAPNCNWFEIR